MFLGVSGSPIKDGNLERLVQFVLGRVRGESEFVRLADYEIRPCMGCVGCAGTNRCVQEDAGNALLEKVVEAEGVLVGGLCYFGHLNALTRTFLERMYPLRHRRMLTAGKVAAGIALGGGMGQETVEGEIGEFLANYMHMNYVGGFHWATQTPPCFKCGYAHECEFGMPAMLYGKENIKDFKVTPEMFRRFEDVPEVVAQAERLADAINGAGTGLASARSPRQRAARPGR